MHYIAYALAASIMQDLMHLSKLKLEFHRRKFRLWNLLGSNPIGVVIPVKFAGDFVGFCNGACTIERSFLGKWPNSASWSSTVEKRNWQQKEKETLILMNKIIKLLSRNFSCIGEQNSVFVLN